MTMMASSRPQFTSASTGKTFASARLRRDKTARQGGGQTAGQHGRIVGERRREGNAVFGRDGESTARMDLLPGLNEKLQADKPCIGNNVHYYLPMPLTNLTVAEDALSLSPEDRAALARLLIESLETDSRTDAEIKAELNSRLEKLLSKKDGGLAFDEVFGRAP